MHARVFVAIAALVLAMRCAEVPAAEHALILDEICSLSGQGSVVEAIAFSPDGTRLASAGFDRVVTWDVESGEQRVTIEEPGRWFMEVAFSPDGKTIAATGSEQHVAIFDAATGEVVHDLSEIPLQELPDFLPAREEPVPLTDYVGAVAFSPDGKMLATGNSDGDITLWDTETAEKQTTVVGHELSISAITYSRDGRKLATGSRDGTARLWDATTLETMGKPLHTLRAEDEEGDTRMSVVFSPDGTRLYSANEFGTIHEWDVQTGKLLRTVRGHGGGITALAISPDGTQLATSSVDDETLRMWDVGNGTAIGVDRRFLDVPSSIAFSPTDAAILATGARDGLVCLWRFQGSEPGVADKPVNGRPFVLRQDIGDDHDLMPPWQSFMAPVDGVITQVDLRPNFFGGAKGTFLIREGDLVDGRVLHEEAYESPSVGGMAWHTFMLPEPVPVQRGQPYMWSLTGAHGLKSAKADVYPGGMAGGDADRDYVFRIHFAPPPGTR